MRGHGFRLHKIDWQRNFVPLDPNHQTALKPSDKSPYRGSLIVRLLDVSVLFHLNPTTINVRYLKLKRYTSRAIETCAEEAIMINT